MSHDTIFMSLLVLVCLLIAAAVIVKAIIDGRRKLELARAKLAQDPTAATGVRLRLLVRTDSRMYGITYTNPEVDGVVLSSMLPRHLNAGDLLPHLSPDETPNPALTGMVAQYKQLLAVLSQKEPPKFVEVDTGNSLTLIPVADIQDVRLELEAIPVSDN